MIDKEKVELLLMKDSREISRSSKSKEGVGIAKRLIAQQRKILKEDVSIERKERKIYDRDKPRLRKEAPLKRVPTMTEVKLRLLRTRENEKKQDKRLYEKEHPTKTKFKKKLGAVVKKLERSVYPTGRLSKSKRIVKPSNVSVRIKEYKAPSILGDPNRFFKEDRTEDTSVEDLFFK